MPPEREAGESEEYLSRQLITYLGNKRALLAFIGEGVKKVQTKLKKRTLKLFDVFSGSGVVARFFKQFSELLIVNDIEKYAALINECYLSNEDERDSALLHKHYNEIVRAAQSRSRSGIIAELYAPKDDKKIQRGERAFYTRRNALYIDTVRSLIDAVPKDAQKFFLAPLLSEASIHANTAGVFKGFYKNRETGVGQFGGKNEDALGRIRGDIRLPFPVFSAFNCKTLICRGDANSIIRTLPEVDLAYLDPPYNQHPYGSNYFMLNLILDYQRPEKSSAVSGIPRNWIRSNYNKERIALETLADLAANINAKYALISFNSEGFIPVEQMKEMLASLGKLEILETNYNTFRGARNLHRRQLHLKEYLYLLEK